SEVCLTWPLEERPVEERDEGLVRERGSRLVEARGAQRVEELLGRAADLLLSAAIDEREPSRVALLHLRPAGDAGLDAFLPRARAGKVGPEDVEPSVAHRFEELVLVPDVRVERRGLDPELAAEATHAERVDALRVDDLERLVDDLGSVESRRSSSP